MKEEKHRFRILPKAGLCLVLVCFAIPGPAYAQAPFYKGKTITIIQAREAGGTGDLRARAALPFLKKYIPGEPNFVNEYMPGAGGRKAANHLYRAARPDGLIVGSMQTALLLHAVLGVTGVQYEIDKLIYLGSPNSAVQYVFGTRKELGATNIERLRSATGLRIGAQSVGHPIYIAGRIAAYLIGIPEPKFIVGYSGPEVDQALARGEVDARVNVADSILQRTPEWIEKGLVHFHTVIEIPKGRKHPRFSGLPEIESFVRTEKERRLIRMYRAFREVGNAYVLPPGTPKDRVDTLKEALRKTFNDPEFHKEYRKVAGEEASSLTAEELEKVIKELPRDPEVISLYKELAGAAPMPPR